MAQCLLPRLTALTLLLVTVFLSTGCERIHLRGKCIQCRISKFEAYYGPLYAQSKETGALELVLLIRSGEVEGMPIARVISDFEFGIPVYVDERNRFLKDNTSLSASDSSLHSLFVDAEEKPVFVGDPALNGRIRET